MWFYERVSAFVKIVICKIKDVSCISSYFWKVKISAIATKDIYLYAWLLSGILDEPLKLIISCHIFILGWGTNLVTDKFVVNLITEIIFITISKLPVTSLNLTFWPHILVLCKYSGLNWCYQWTSPFQE